jgi:hypothetical protein
MAIVSPEPRRLSKRGRGPARPVYQGTGREGTGGPPPDLSAPRDMPKAGIALCEIRTMRIEVVEREADYRPPGGDIALDNTRNRQYNY